MNRGTPMPQTHLCSSIDEACSNVFITIDAWPTLSLRSSETHVDRQSNAHVTRLFCYDPWSTSQARATPFASDHSRHRNGRDPLRSGRLQSHQRLGLKFKPNSTGTLWLPPPQWDASGSVVYHIQRHFNPHWPRCFGSRIARLERAVRWRRWGLGDWRQNHAQCDWCGRTPNPYYGCCRSSIRHLLHPKKVGALPVEGRDELKQTNEIRMFIPVLDTLDIDRQTITADALLTQRKLARYLVEQRAAHDVLIAKNNQPTIAKAIHLLFEQRSEPDFREPYTLEHGRIESRSIWTSTALNDDLDFPCVGQVFAIQCQPRKCAQF